MAHLRRLVHTFHSSMCLHSYLSTCHLCWPTHCCSYLLTRTHSSLADSLLTQCLCWSTHHHLHPLTCPHPDPLTRRLCRSTHCRSYPLMRRLHWSTHRRLRYCTR
ncbi:uncharacterized protein B0H18DRAFT_1008637 [Fomitopsis serialis]|uniref:uncharacterized protein n=1 Tax=Fomitopsis serialis TaxID=139415 RepID=UPI002008D426|nr:uncharacterized protein B0H18DRAFT_1008637 [Neoantrodia serialis]KAH9925839.1 hypothetical protein B0H18DRAFT_1008637 [Neoantrodia serialis]